MGERPLPGREVALLDEDAQDHGDTAPVPVRAVHEHRTAADVIGDDIRPSGR